jgi:ABC-2 type transport system ATP-binding protein
MLEQRLGRGDVTSNPSTRDSMDIMVRVEGLTKRYGKNTAVDGISFNVRHSEIFALLGPNGAGKTTTLEMLEGILRPDAGQVTIDGLDIRRNRRAIQQRIGVQLQATSLFTELNTYETVKLFGSFFDRALSADELLHEVGLEPQAKVYPQNLSGGQRQRLALALALVNDPRTLFLDEPTSGLDPQSRHLLWDTIVRLRERGKTIILTTHFMDEAETLSDRIAIMDHGRIIAQDSPSGLISQLSASAAIEFRLTPEPEDFVLRALPAVTGLQHGLDGRWLIYTEDAEATLLALVKSAHSGSGKLDHIQIHAPTLEDVFLKLTGRALRD